MTIMAATASAMLSSHAFDLFVVFIFSNLLFVLLLFLLWANQCVAPKSVGGESNLFILPGRLPGDEADAPRAGQPFLALHVNYGRGNDGKLWGLRANGGCRD